MGFQRILALQHKLQTFLKAGSVESRERLDPTILPHPCELRETEECKDDTDENYHSWTMKHPSALTKFDEMMSRARQKKIVVFLDYDGTLSPIVDEPERAFMSDAMRSAVRDVAEHFPTAIISGRCRDKVYNFVQLPDVYYAGSHGMDILVPFQPMKRCNTKLQTRAKDKEAVLFQPAEDFLPKIEEINKVLEEKTKRIEGAFVENNKFCLSVHFRRVSEEDWASLEEQVKAVVNEYPNFRLTRGRKVMEIRPCIKWDKGHALEYLLETLGFGSSTDVLPFYLGDDQTDEDAFKALERRGEGFPIIVASIPRETKASYSLRDPSEVLSFLLLLAKWGRNHSTQLLST